MSRFENNLAWRLAATLSAAIVFSPSAAIAQMQPLPGAAVTIAQPGSQLGDAATKGAILQFVLQLLGRYRNVGYILAWPPDEHIVRLRDDAVPPGIDSAIASFNQSQPRYRAVVNDDGTVLVRPMNETFCTEVARRPGSVTVTDDVFGVQASIYAAWSGQPRPGYSHALASDEEFYRQVTVSVHEAPLSEALDAMVRQVPGLGWRLEEDIRPSRTDPRRTVRVCTLGLAVATGTTTTAWWITDDRP